MSFHFFLPLYCLQFAWDLVHREDSWTCFLKLAAWGLDLKGCLNTTDATVGCGLGWAAGAAWPGLKPVSCHGASVWSSLAEQLFVRKLKTKPTFEEIRSKWWKMRYSRGKADCLQCPGEDCTLLLLITAGSYRISTYMFVYSPCTSEVLPVLW